ncbi:hypothetical protein ACFCY9_07760 [Streptomyces fimicarius]
MGIEYPVGGVPDQALVLLPAGRRRVRGSHTKADEEDCGGLVELLPTQS